MTKTEKFSPAQTVGLMAGLMMGVLLTLMDQTVVSTALPTVVAQLGGLNLYAWVFSAYLLAQTSFLAIFGKLSDLFGRRRMYLVGMTAFMAGSILCGQAQSMQQLILFRGLQGIGGAGLMPTALAILGFHYEPKERARLQGILGTVGALAIVLGPIVGSLIAENVSWRWIFYVNLPFGLVSALLVVLFLREPRVRRTAPPNLDYVGALALTGWVVPLMLAFFYSKDHSWSSIGVLGLLASSGVLLVLFLFNESRSREPILPLRVFANRTIAAAAAVALIRAVAFYSLIVYVPLLVQGVRGGSSESARNALTIFSLPGILGAAAAGLLVARNVGYRILMTAGLVMSGLGLWLIARIGMDAGQAELLGNLALSGLGVGLTQVTIILAIQNSVGREHMGTASSLAQFFTNLAGTVGIGLLGTYQSNVLADGIKPVIASPALKQLSSSAAQMLSNPSNLGQVLTNPRIAATLPAQLVGALRMALQTSLHNVFIVGLVLTAAAVAVSMFMRGSAVPRPLGEGKVK